MYDLFTLPALVEARPAPPQLLFALNKADRAGARTVETVQAILEAELCVTGGGAEGGGSTTSCVFTAVRGPRVMAFAPTPSIAR